MCVCVCTCSYRHRSEVDLMYLPHSLFTLLFWDEFIHLTWSSLAQEDWMVCFQAPGMPCLYFSCTDYKYSKSCLDFFSFSFSFSYRLRIWTPVLMLNSLPTKTSPQFLGMWLFTIKTLIQDTTRHCLSNYSLNCPFSVASNYLLQFQLESTDITSHRQNSNGNRLKVGGYFGI